MTPKRLMLLGLCMAAVAAVLTYALQSMLGGGAGGSRPGSAQTNGARRSGAAPGAAMASKLPAGYRAITVGLRDAGSGAFLYPGAIVDLLATIEASGRGGSQRETMTVTFLQAVRVLAVNQETSDSSSAASGDARRSANRFTVTLAVTPQQAAEVEYASARGAIGVSLRPDQDAESERGRLAAATARSLMPPVPAAAGSADSEAQAPASPSDLASPWMWSVTVIRGGSTTRHDFPAPAAP
jgi:Flp pilus assembly protein CpaB